MTQKMKFPDIDSLLDDSPSVAVKVQTETDVATTDMTETDPVQNNLEDEGTEVLVGKKTEIIDVSFAEEKDVVQSLRLRIKEIGRQPGVMKRGSNVKVDLAILSTLQSCDLGHNITRIVNAVLMEYICQHKAALKAIMKSNLLTD